MHIPKWLSTTFSFLLIGLVLVSYLVFHKPSVQSSEYSHALTIGTTEMRVAYANTEAARERGLSGTSLLLPNQGMLFIFPTSADVSFWMKDMNYPLDMIWIDADKKVIGSAQNVAPNTYPNTFSSGQPVEYVLEVSAGFVAEHSITPGTAVTF